MTRTLQKAIERLESLPAERQDLLAQLLLDEIDGDDTWEATTAKHADKVAELSQSILAADERGECEPLDTDRL